MENIAAGIILYNPNLIRLKENIAAIRSQVDFIVLVDNSSDNIEEIEFEYNNSNDIFFIKNNKNIGIATALNQIVHYCEQKKCLWVLTLDQDSVVPVNLIRNYERYIHLEKIGVMTPKIVDRNYFEEETYFNNNLKLEYEYVKTCITSASFINIPICKEIGYFDDKMFIDLVDFEYCIRINKADYKILKLNNISLIHQLGNLNVINFLGKKIFVTNHSATRVYYYARNSIYYLNKHRDYLSGKMVYFNLLKKAFKIILFESKKINKIKSIFLGIRDGTKML
jgi:rhamnosyltransferase